jgi:integrase/recombinase XerD
LDKNLINFVNNFNKKNQEAWSPKYNRERQLPITEEQANIFRKWVNEVRPENLDHPYLLWLRQGKFKSNMISGKRLQHWCNQTGKSVGLKHGKTFRPHVLRYSFATHYYQVSKDVKLMCDLLGHSNVSITSEYLQLGKKETMDKARRLFGMN